MQVTRESLLDNLYSAFDKAPEEAVALRIGSNGALNWVVTVDNLTVTDSNQLVTDIPLTGTLLDVLNALRDAGIEIKYVNSDVLHLNAAALLKGSGSEVKSNGDLLKIFTSPLWALLDSYSVELSFAEQQIAEAIADLYINTATGEILDYWGEYFGCSRLTGELDADYRTRMIYEILRPKSNKYALINAASAVAGQMIDIYEPWQDLFWLSDSHLDNERMYDGGIWSPYVFRPILRSQNNIKWTNIYGLLEKIRPAAVFPLSPEWIPDVRGNTVGVDSLGLVRADHAFYAAIYADKTNLDDYHFGDPIVMNYRISKFDLYGFGNFTLSRIGWDNSWDDRHWDSIGPEVHNAIPSQELRLRDNINYVRAQIVLSDMDEPLGDLRVRFPMANYTERKPAKLDDYELSNWDDGYRVIPVEDVSWPNHGAGWLLGKEGTGFTGTLNEFFVKTGSYLDVSKLSVGLLLSESMSTPNYRIGHYDVFGLGNFTASGVHWESGWDERHWGDLGEAISGGVSVNPMRFDSKIDYVRAQVVLSDMDEKLGELRCRLPGAVVISGNTPYLDDFSLSDFDCDTHYDAIEDVQEQIVARGFKLPNKLFGFFYKTENRLGARLMRDFTLSHHLDLDGTKPEASTKLGIYTVFSNILNGAIGDSETTLTWDGNWKNLSWDYTVYKGVYVGHYDVKSFIADFANLSISNAQGQQVERLIANCELTQGLVVAGAVVTAEFLQLNPTQGNAELQWLDNWGALPWSSTINYSGIRITISTETL